MRLVASVLACGIALPAHAEGGYFPSLTVVFGLILLYTVGFAAVATAVAYGAVKLLRRQHRLRIGRMFTVALASWTVGLVVYLSGVFDPYLDEYQAAIVGLGMTIGLIGVVELLTATPTTPQ